MLIASSFRNSVKSYGCENTLGHYLFIYLYLFDLDHDGPYAITHIKYTQEAQ